MLIEEMSPKIYELQKRNKNKNEHNFTKDVAGAGPYGVFCSEGGGNLKLRHRVRVRITRV